MRRTNERLERLESALDALAHEADLMKTVLIVKEPETPLAAGAFDGLRKQIVAVSQEHWNHLAQLAIMDAAINHVNDVADLRTISSQWLDQAGIRRVSRPEPDSVSECFEFVGQGDEAIEVMQPAYVDEVTGRILKKGRIRMGTRDALPTAIEAATGDDNEAAPDAPYGVDGAHIDATDEGTPT